MVAPPAVALALSLTVGLGAIFAMKARPPVKVLRTKTNAQWMAAFTEWKGAPPTDADWEGELIDLFSPDYMSTERKPWDTDPKSRRFIDLRDGELQVSEHLGPLFDNAKSGRRFDPTTTANPTLDAMASPLQKSLSFISKVPPEAPPYADAQNGALNFTATMGKAFGRKVLKLNTIYNGSGGSFTGFEAPGGEFNFWAYV